MRTVVNRGQHRFSFLVHSVFFLSLMTECYDWLKIMKDLSCREKNKQWLRSTETVSSATLMMLQEKHPTQIIVLSKKGGGSIQDNLL